MTYFVSNGMQNLKLKQLQSRCFYRGRL